MASAMISHQRHGGDLAALLHRGNHVVRAHQRLGDLVAGLLAEGGESGGAAHRHRPGRTGQLLPAMPQPRPAPCPTRPR